MFTLSNATNTDTINSTIAFSTVSSSSSINASQLLKNSSLEDVYKYPPYIRNTATVTCIVIFVLGTLGNILVSLVIVRSKELRNTTNYFLINLGIADLLVIIVCMPTILIELNSKPEVWLLGEFMCKIIPYVEMSVAHGSILTMLAISFERYYAICKPLKVGYKCTKFRAFIIILCIWIIALLSTLPLLFIAKQSSATYLDGTQVEVCLTQANDPWSKAFFLTIITLFFFLPLLVLLIIYVAITKRLCINEDISFAECVQMRARRQVIVILATVILCFFICLLPFRLFTLWLLFSSSQVLDSISMETYYICLYTSRVMLYLNSALNPLLYNLISSKFRNAFIKVLCCYRVNSLNRILIRQNTFNTTTTTMSLSGIPFNNSILNKENLSVKFISNSGKYNASNASQLVNNSNNCKKINLKLQGRQYSLQFPLSTTPKSTLVKQTSLCTSSTSSSNTKQFLNEQKKIEKQTDCQSNIHITSISQNLDLNNKFSEKLKMRDCPKNSDNINLCSQSNQSTKEIVLKLDFHKKEIDI